MDHESEFFECICTSDEHTLRLTLENYGPNDKELYTSVFLNQYRNFFQRVWVAIKYVFCYKCKYGHWDCIMFKPEDADRLITLIQKFKNQEKE
jgi:hypothetical protein